MIQQAHNLIKVTNVSIDINTKTFAVITAEVQRGYCTADEVCITKSNKAPLLVLEQVP